MTEQLSVVETAILLCLYAAKRVGFQGGGLTTPQLEKIARPYYDVTREEIDELNRQIVNDDEACRKLIAPLL